MFRRAWIVFAGVALGLPAAGARPDGGAEGFFGFRQAEATVLCETPDLRVSVMQDAGHLYIQAVIFGDSDDALGETSDGRKIGDSGSVLIDADADGKPTANVDRTYSNNPWPHLPGLHYSVVLGERTSTSLKGDSKGRGAISYVEIDGGRKVRVDSFLVPLEEIGREAGETVRIAYWGSSPVPALTVNSIGFEREGKYYAHNLPREGWHEVKLKAGAGEIDVQAVPEGRGTIERAAPKPAPAPGSAPPEVSADAWLNWVGASAPTLAGLKGKVVVVEFWATWCAPCVAGIPHLNEIHEKYSKDGLVLLSLTDQAKGHVEDFMEKRPMLYTVGVGSGTSGEYGVRGIPHALVIGRDGLLVWAGHPQSAEFEKQIEAALRR